MNKCVFIGNLTKEPEMSTANNGTSICKFTLAVKRDFKNENGEAETDFFNITVFGKIGDNCGKYLKKGSKCCVVGRLQNRSYDAQDGTKRYVTDIIANEVEFLSPSNSGTQSEPQYSQPTAIQTELQPIDDDSLPF